MNSPKATIIERQKLSCSISTNGGLVAGLSQGVVHDAAKIVQYDTMLDFPVLGKTDTLYISTKDNSSWRWGGMERKYFCVGRDYSEITQIDGGNE